MQLAEITLGNFSYVLIWALLVVVISAVAWPQSKMPSYKDVLASTLGISFEALGIELTRGQQALILPLLTVILFALLIRYLPEDSNRLGFSIIILRVSGTVVAIFLAFLFFGVQLMTLLLAYKGWWEIFIVFPG